MARTRKGEEFVKQVFGGSLYQQGRGFYVSLELLAILRGSLILEQKSDSEEFVLPPPDKRARFARPTHDFARRLMAGWFETNEPEQRKKYLDDDATETLRALLLGLHAPVPGRRRAPKKWRGWHLYPYPADFIHYDALQRRSRISIERNAYRGGGGLAHRILRSDTDEVRLAQMRAGFRRLLADSESPLGELARALSRLDSAEGAEEAWEDVTEEEAKVIETCWVEQLREGVARILNRDDIADSKRIEALMNWVPFCIVRHQQSLAYAVLVSNYEPSKPYSTLVDCQAENNSIRDAARREFKLSTAGIQRALAQAVEDDEDLDSDIRRELLEGSRNWMSGPKTFFTTTAYAVGFANAHTGNRWFTLAPQLLETIVLAKVASAMPFEDFCHGVLYEQLGMVIDAKSAEARSEIDLDQSSFDRNANELAETLHDLGMLQRYSDMTRMVGEDR